MAHCRKYMMCEAMNSEPIQTSHNLVSKGTLYHVTKYDIINKQKTFILSLMRIPVLLACFQLCVPYYIKQL